MIRHLRAFRRAFGSSRAGRPPQRSRRHILPFDRLEDRTAPAIVGTLSLVGSTLQYSGKGANNYVTIRGSDQSLSINDQAGEIDIVGVPGFDGDNTGTVVGKVPSSVLTIEIKGNSGSDTIRVGASGFGTTRIVKLSAETIATVQTGTLTTPSVILASTGGLGIGTRSAPFRLNATSLRASATGTGAIHVLDTAGGLNVDAASTYAGDIEVETRNGPLYVRGKIEARIRGDIGLAASPAAGSTLTVTSPSLAATSPPAGPSPDSSDLSFPTLTAAASVTNVVGSASSFPCPETGILDINADVITASGNIRLETYEGAATSNIENIVIRTVTVSTSAGNIDIRSADNLNVIGSTIDASGTPPASGNVRVRGDYKSKDTYGSIVKLNGLVTGQTVEIRTGDSLAGAGADRLFVGSNVRSKVDGNTINVYGGLAAGDLNDRITFEGIALPVANAALSKLYNLAVCRNFLVWYFEYKP
jgi:hypothetical protein